MTTPKPATRKAAPIKSVPPPEPPKNAHERRVAELLDGAGTAAAILTLAPATRPDAAAIVLHAPAIAEGAAKWADADEKVARLLDRITTMGPASAFLGAIVAFGLQIAVNHDLLQPGILGTVAPEVLVEAVVGGDDDGDNPDTSGNQTA